MIEFVDKEKYFQTNIIIKEIFLIQVKKVMVNYMNKMVQYIKGIFKKDYIMEKEN
jgi:hypothetical protein